MSELQDCSDHADRVAAAQASGTAEHGILAKAFFESVEKFTSRTDGGDLFELGDDLGLGTEIVFECIQKQ